jgi:ferric-dicitrate binding protein FerR (iron transport regulator)
MITCEDARLLASREVDRELDAASLARLEAHVASCAPCRAERSALGRVDALMADAFTGHPFDARLVHEIVRMAEARKLASGAPVAAPRGAIIRFRAGGLVAAAAAAIVLISVGIGSWGGGTPTPPPADAPAPVLARAYGLGLTVGHVNGAPQGGEGLAVHEGEAVLNRGGAGSIQLEDGTRVDLRADTTIALHRERDGGISVVVSPGHEPSSGEVYCEVAKQKDHPFRVVTNALSATVVGTKFLVRATGRESSVAVVEGRVQVASGQQRVLLSRDQEAIVAASSPGLFTRALADARAALSWNKRVVDSMPAASAPVRPAPPAPVNSSRPTGQPGLQPAPQPAQSDMDLPIGPAAPKSGK